MPSKQYDYAISCVEKGKNIEAIEWFDKLFDYKDSKNQLFKIYNSYAGYYQNEDLKVSLHLVVSKGNTVTIELTKETEDSKLIKITESSKFDSNYVEFNFTNSDNEQGLITIQLNDTYLSISVNSNEKTSLMGNFETEFNLSEKSDKPFSPLISKELLMNILESETTIKDLQEYGYDIDYVSKIYENSVSKYKIKNTDISFAVFDFDVSQDTDSSYRMDLFFEEPVILELSVPAEIICPEKIGELNIPFVKNEFVYIPSSELNYPFENINTTFKSEKIDDNTQMTIISKKRVGNHNFNVVSAATERHYIGICDMKFQSDFGLETVGSEIVAENDNYYLISCKSGRCDCNSVAYYKINKNNTIVEFVTELPCENYFDYTEYQYLEYPELFKEFIE